MAKPVGPACNLGCEYCDGLEKKALYPGVTDYRMPDELPARHRFPVGFVGLRLDGQEESRKRSDASKIMEPVPRE